MKKIITVIETALFPNTKNDGKIFILVRDLVEAFI